MTTEEQGKEISPEERVKALITEEVNGQLGPFLQEVKGIIVDQGKKLEEAKAIQTNPEQVAQGQEKMSRKEIRFDRGSLDSAVNAA